jgi:rhomboid protease GluP
VPLPARWRYNLKRWRNDIAAKFRSEPNQPRPRLCPACGTLVGPGATRCHQCGTNLSYSFAAAGRSVSRFLPQTSPVTYGVLTVCCLMYGVSLLATMHLSGFSAPTGGLGALFNLGSINSSILLRMGESLPLGYEIQQPWRLVTAIFLHAGLLHIGFNLWILLDLAPMIEEMYGSARFFFIFIVTGVGGYLASSASGHVSVGASGALLGMVGILLAITRGRSSIGARMLRSQLLYWLAYIAILGILMPGVDNMAHIGGFATGFLLGKIMPDHAPSDLGERRVATFLGWTTGLAVAASFAFMLINYFAMGPG